MQAKAYHVFRLGDSITPLAQANNRSLSFWVCILFVDYGLHKQVSGGAQAISNDWATSSKPVQADISEYGWPETLIYGNGPYYTVDAFTSVMNAYSINHITSSSHYPQSNGLAEKYVQIVKSLFHKAKEEGKALFKCLMIYGNTPLSGSLQSPMQILQSRSVRSDLPMS